MILFLTFGHLIFGFVSYFDIRISSFVRPSMCKSCPQDLVQSLVLWARILYLKVGKRLFDLVLAVPGFFLISPALAAIALLIKIIQRGPVFFNQIRPGYRGDSFKLYKFCTMADFRDANGALLPDAMRLTPFGRWLRSTSIDELPEVWNVLKGDMSLVGPRPLLMQYLERYSPEQARRDEV
jgi:sugar transferase EpsL